MFDKVFDEDVQQQGVWEYVNESVSAFVQGYNVSVLAYGQSGSGKSYTMGTSGPAEQGDSQMMGKSYLPRRHPRCWRGGGGVGTPVADLLVPGVIPRAAGVLFEHLFGPSGFKRNGSSSLRTPPRYSTSSAQNLPTLASLGKSSDGSSWQMKATYVEVRVNITRRYTGAQLMGPPRSITNSYEIFLSRTMFRPRNVRRSPSGKISKAGYC